MQQPNLRMPQDAINACRRSLVKIIKKTKISSSEFIQPPKEANTHLDFAHNHLNLSTKLLAICLVVTKKCWPFFKEPPHTDPLRQKAFRFSCWAATGGPTTGPPGPDFPSFSLFRSAILHFEDRCLLTGGLCKPFEYY
jgi:hypothetical protein